MKNRKSWLGFTLIELMITIAILGILAAIAIPLYQDYTKKAYYSEIVRATAPYKVAVSQCMHDLNTATGCNAGTNGIPPAIATAQGGVASLGVTAGVITVTPVAQHGILATDTYILTPTLEADSITWASSGGGVDAGYAK